MSVEITKDEYLKALGTVVAYEQSQEKAVYSHKQEYPDTESKKEKKEELPDKD
jgi:hypothetical protein